MLRRALVCGTLFLWVGVMAGCAKPPVEEMDAATAAVKRAETAEVAMYAPQEFRALDDSLKAMTALADKQQSRFALLRNYKQAKTLAQATVDLAEKVENIALENKARMRKETEDLVAQAQTAIDSVSAVLAVAPVVKDTKADIQQFKMDLSAFQASLTEGRSALSREDFSGAQATARAVLSKASTLKNEIQAGMEKYQQWKKGRRN
ncbi:MAG: hypothetical protein V1800_12165 [Candidatus Latescibacterota bacterium]